MIDKCVAPVVDSFARNSILIHIRVVNCRNVCTLLIFNFRLFVFLLLFAIQYYLGAAGGFIALAYIGSVIDNFLLSYLAILGVALFPGLSRHGVGKIVIEKLLDQVKQIKEKTIKKN